MGNQETRQKFTVPYAANRVWSVMNEHKATLIIAQTLHNTGISSAINACLTSLSDRKLRKHPSSAMLKSRKYYLDNQKRINELLHIFADEKSKMVWGGVIAYRADRKPLKKELISPIQEQYFAPDIIHVQKGEVFADCGAFSGDTIRLFIKNAARDNVSLYKIVALEPDKTNQSLLRSGFGDNGKVVIVDKGVSDHDAVLYFKTSGGQSHITQDESEATCQISVARMDDIPICKDVTWIKMDIEGSEFAALHGAEETIRRNHPKLTICLYHSDEDMLRIPEYIHELVPEYKLYVRQYRNNGTETVLYAVI